MITSFETCWLPNKTAAPNAGIAPQLTIGHHWPGVGEPDRSAKDVRRITLEIGLLGRSGLDINDPARSYRLRSMPGDFTVLQLAAYMFVGLRQIAPDTGPGIDFTGEYRLAAAIREAQRG